MGDAYERELRHLIGSAAVPGTHRWGRRRRAAGCLRALQRLRHQPNAGREHGGADAQRTPTRRRRRSTSTPGRATTLSDAVQGVA